LQPITKNGKAYIPIIIAREGKNKVKSFQMVSDKLANKKPLNIEFKGFFYIQSNISELNFGGDAIS